MITSATRPFVPSDDRTSSMTIKNKEAFQFCAGSWVNRSDKDSIGFSYQACDTITPDLPVEEVPVDNGGETGALSGLSASLLAVTAMFAALNF